MRHGLAAGFRTACLLVAGILAQGQAAAAEMPGCTLRIGMTLADLPTQNGAPDQGTEGVRFMGTTLYDSLINWDLSHADRASALTPGLATSWAVDEQDKTRWTFKLRPGVQFQDGSPFDADAVVWNLDKVLNKAAPQYDPAQVAQVVWRMPGVRGYRKIDGSTVEISTKGPDATLPYQLTAVLMASPARWRESGSWQGFARHPSGTGPWMLDDYVPRDHATLLRNAAYWDASRVPRCARLVLRPIPDPSTRTAALLSGQLDWIESPAPDMLDKLRSSGDQVLTGTMPHIWPLHAQPHAGQQAQRYPRSKGAEPCHRSGRHRAITRRPGAGRRGAWWRRTAPGLASPALPFITIPPRRGGCSRRRDTARRTGYI